MESSLLSVSDLTIWNVVSITSTMCVQQCKLVDNYSYVLEVVD